MMQSYRREPGRVKCKRDRKLREMMIQKDADGLTVKGSRDDLVEIML